MGLSLEVTVVVFETAGFVFDRAVLFGVALDGDTSLVCLSCFLGDAFDCWRVLFGETVVDVFF